MRLHHAFTLLEVLFAVVLLSLVVTVCVPYMRSVPSTTALGNLTEFAASVDEEIYKLQLSQPDALTLDQIQGAVVFLGTTCETASKVDTKLHGQWITITNGTHTILRWAYVPEADLSGKQDDQAVGP